MKRAVFLDRDGVLNQAQVRDGKPYPPPSVDQMRITVDAPACLQALRDAGFLLVVVTNQPDVARGTQTRQQVDAINAALQAAMPLDAFYVCFHDGPDKCSCRKPKPGLLLQAAQDLAIDLPSSFLIGDRWRDVQAGAQAGVRTVFLDFQYAEQTPDPPATKTASSLREGVDWILSLP